MSKSSWKRAGLAATAAAVVLGVTACQSGGDGDGKKGASSEGKPQSGGEVTKVLTAAFKKTTEAKSAKVTMEIKAPEAIEGGGSTTMSGVMGWDPTVMDVKVTSSGAAALGGPAEVRTVWVDGVLYTDVGAAGAEVAEMFGGKRWMKMDLKAIAEGSGNKALEKQLTGNLDDMNQSPAESLAVLLESKDIKHVGSAKVDGVDTEHYKGSISVEEMVNKNDSLVLSKADRAEMIKAVKEAGITSYDTQVWVNGDGYPVKMDIAMASKAGPVTISAKYSEYGAAAQVEAPPAKDVVDFAQAMKDVDKQLNQVDKDLADVDKTLESLNG
ncbi:hypothetical protein [Streptomyces sp. NPDC047315]|uniref:hypothetical protein n=1 Tax=Streptomyces sp. NPDC047315 TaxID=3155142 RepID=UPI0033EFFFF7